MFEPTSANKALELLGKHLGMFKDKVELTGELNVEQKTELNLSGLSINELEQLEKLLEKEILNKIQIEKARKSLIHFTTRTKQDFVTGWFNILIAKELQQFYQDVVDGKQPRLMIFAPPRSGKSELFSRRFPAWAFGQNPNLQINRLLILRRPC